MPLAGLPGRPPMPPAARLFAMSASSPRRGAAVVSAGVGSVSVSLFCSALVLSSVSSVDFLGASVVAWL